LGHTKWADFHNLENPLVNLECKLRNLIFFLGVLFVSSVAAQSIPSKEGAKSEEFCTEKWTKRGQLDASRYRFCLRQESEGYEELVSLARKYNDQPWIQSALNFSVEKWTKKGVRQDRMVAYTFKQIAEGWEDLVYQSKQSSFDKNKAAACISTWAPQYNMVVFCYKKD
jgi:hypothetical protein